MGIGEKTLLDLRCMKRIKNKFIDFWSEDLYFVYVGFLDRPSELNIATM